MKHVVSMMCLLVCMCVCVVGHAEPQGSVKAFSIIERGQYFESVTQMIDEAKESVFVIMPEIAFSPKEREARSTTLLQALVRAHRRDVFVFVLLNLSDVRRDAPINLDAFFFLNDNGVAVHFDDVVPELTMASVVVDREMVLVGSSTWTEESLANPYQINVSISSSVYAQEVIDFVTSIPVYDNPLALEYYNQIYLSPHFVQHPNGMKAFHVRNDHEGLMLYLYLLREYSKRGQEEWIEVSADELAEEFGFAKSERKESARAHIRLLLERLRETYVLISFDQISEEFDFRITFFDLAEGEKLSLPFLEGIRISDSLFEAGWVKKLTVGELYVYFFLLSLEARVGYQSWFDVPYDEMKLLPGVRDDQCLAAVRGLRAYNLINVHYRDMNELVDVIYSDFECLVRTPYFEEWYKDEVKSLTKRYPSRFVNQAVSIAREMLLGHDVESIEKIIVFIQTYSHLVVNDVFIRHIKPLYPENSYRTLAYFEEKLKEEQKADDGKN